MQVYVVSWDKEKLTPYRISESEGITFYKRSDFSEEDLVHLVKQIRPEVLYVSGRMDKTYLKVARRYKGTNIKIVSGMDNQWLATPRQLLAIAISPIIYKRYFDYMWVAGKSQRKYCRYLGFEDDKIINDIYTADVPFFQKAYQDCKQVKRINFPHNFCFVGRFVKRKGLDTLLEGFKRTFEEMDHDWTLTLIGQGPMEPLLVGKGVTINGFIQPEELVKEIKNIGVFCLPSRFEAWGVVIHEFAAAGIPLICSDACGATEVFVQPEENGYLFRSGDADALKNQMLKIIQSSDEKLLEMGEKSYLLSNRITPESFADSLYSITDHL